MRRAIGGSEELRARLAVLDPRQFVENSGRAAHAVTSR